MPIEFNCQVCHQRLRTPDGSEGRQCQCPDCGTLVNVPTTATTSPTKSAAASSEPAGSIKPVLTPVGTSPAIQNPANRSPTNTLTIPCPRCRFELVCSPSLLGTKGQCRNCQHIFTIATGSPNQPSDSQPSAPELVFRCPSCAQLFAGQAEMEGRKGKCHACGEVFAIALEPVAHGPSIISADRPSHSTGKPLAGHQANAAMNTPAQSSTNVVISSTPREAPIQFTCQRCAGLMEVPASTSGQQTLCPYCGETLTIPTMAVKRAHPSLPPASTAQSWASTNVAADTLSSLNMSTELGDLGQAPQANPYGAPSLSPHDAPGAEVWSTPPRKKRPRGLTFTNAFELTFDSLFPSCLIAPFLFGMAAVVAFGVLMMSMSFAGYTVRKLELSDVTLIQVVVYSAMGCGVMVGIFVATAAYCMTCNTALHAVRGKRISARVALNTGDAYAGMLAIMLGWTVFNLLRRFGIPFIVQELASTSGPQTATFVGLVIIGLLALVQVVLTLLMGFVPYALLDGQRLPEAIGTSISIWLDHLLTVLPVLICGWLLYLLVGIVSLGLGLVLLIGASFYLNAAIYHLAED